MPHLKRKYKARVPGTRVSLLTATSKMPGPSWSLPAHKACPREAGNICQACYAAPEHGGSYRYENVRNAQKARWDWTREALRTPEETHAWVRAMVEGIRETGCEYFRVHDSGDMFSAGYAEMWLRVASCLPEVKFWIPTRAWQQPAGVLPILDPLMGVLKRMAQLPNVTVRPSALNFGDRAPRIDGLHAGTTASMPDVFRAAQCGAPDQNGECGDCRKCWDEKSVPVSYRKH